MVDADIRTLASHISTLVMMLDNMPCERCEDGDSWTGRCRDCQVAIDNALADSKRIAAIRDDRADERSVQPEAAPLERAVVVYIAMSNRDGPDIDTSEVFEGAWESLELAQEACRTHCDGCREGITAWIEGEGIHGRYWHSQPFREAPDCVLSVWISEYKVIAASQQQPGGGVEG